MEPLIDFLIIQYRAGKLTEDDLNHLVKEKAISLDDKKKIISQK